MQVIREGQKLTYLLIAAAMAEISKPEEVTFGSGTDNGNSISVEQETTSDGIRLTVTAREPGYAALTVVASRKSDGLTVAVAGEQFFVVSNEDASQVVPVATSLRPEQEARKPAAASGGASSTTATPDAQAAKGTANKTT